MKNANYSSVLAHANLRWVYSFGASLILETLNSWAYHLLTARHCCLLVLVSNFLLHAQIPIQFRNHAWRKQLIAIIDAHEPALPLFHHYILICVVCTSMAGNSCPADCNKQLVWSWLRLWDAWIFHDSGGTQPLACLMKIHRSRGSFWTMCMMASFGMGWCKCCSNVAKLIGAPTGAPSDLGDEWWMCPCLLQWDLDPVWRIVAVIARLQESSCSALHCWCISSVGGMRLRAATLRGNDKECKNHESQQWRPAEWTEMKRSKWHAIE